MNAQELAWTAATAILISIASLSSQSECSLEQVEDGGSWIIKDSKGCGYNRGVDPFYVFFKWGQCQATGGYDENSWECNVLDLTPGGAGEGGTEDPNDNRTELPENEDDSDDSDDSDQ